MLAVGAQVGADRPDTAPGIAQPSQLSRIPPPFAALISLTHKPYIGPSDPLTGTEGHDILAPSWYPNVCTQWRLCGCCPSAASRRMRSCDQPVERSLKASVRPPE